MVERTVEVAAEQPVIVRFGQREIVVPLEPLARTSRSRRDVDLVDEGSNVLVLAPIPVSRLTAALTCAAGAVIFLGGVGTLTASAIVIAERWGSGLLFAVLGLPVVVVGGLMAAAPFVAPGALRFRFDRASGELIADRLEGWHRRPVIQFVRKLADVAAVQLLCVGGRSGLHPPNSAGRLDSTFEMNLVLGDELQPRLHLCSHNDPQWMRRQGEKLAALLQVPVVDQLGPVDRS
jgi:hypothetical protein